MKTIDEVIDAMERCSRPHYFDCTGCPYEDDEAETGCHSEDRDADVLHYLKAFRDAKDALDTERERSIEAYCQWKDAKEKLEAQTSQMMWVDKHFKFEEPNNPLTWDELQQMDGKPVWATFDNENGTWYIAKVYDDEVVLYEWGQEFGERISGAWDYTPKRWQAYRKERK